MDSKRKSYTPEYKLKVALESMQQDTTQEEVCKQCGIASSMLHRWRKELQANASAVFQDKRDPRQKAKELVLLSCQYMSFYQVQRKGRSVCTLVRLAAESYISV